MCAFDGTRLEIVGYAEEIFHLRADDLGIKRKGRTDDGGELVHFAAPGLSTHIELYFPPSETTEMDRLLTALHHAGASDL